MNKPRTIPTSAAAAGAPRAATSPPAAVQPQGESLRESVEAIIVAIILTLTFRTFLGENYQIPTGSMAPTLQGRHMDVVCPDCGYQYRTGASVENEEDGVARGEITVTTCPICRYQLELDKQNNLNQRSFAGDRIIVSKLAYVFDEPSRWDVFVFKYPGNPKINYIKRLVGMPGESLRIRHGDVFTLDPATAQLPADQQQYRIVRKPAEKVTAMLQLVDDTYYLGSLLQQVAWPSRWTPLNDGDPGWQATGDGRHAIQPTDRDAWLGYRHLIPRGEDWRAIENNEPPDLRGYAGQLITDYYAYNDIYGDQFLSTGGLNWVGDLAIEAEVKVVSASGELLLDIIEGGMHHQCRIDIGSGQSQLELDGGKLEFHDGTDTAVPAAAAATGIRGPGTYTVRFANIDDQLFLWIDDQLVTFPQPTTFNSPQDLTPQWSPQDPGDLVPLRIGARGAEIQVERLRVFRDVHYVAARFDDRVGDSDYRADWAEQPDEIQAILRNPHQWQMTDLFSSRRVADFTLGTDQFFPMGDNSPQSKDGRLWSQHTRKGLLPPPYVERQMLIGKAVFIYWPHGWRVLTDWIGVIPNYQRFGRIR